MPIVQSTIFWASGSVFFIVQLAMLLYLLRQRHRSEASTEEYRRRHDEVVWTLVPASLVAVLGLMLAGLIRSPWSGS